MNFPIPLLIFKSTDGLQFKEFNTLRLGGGWGKRLKKGDRVLLADKLNVLCEAKVTRVCVEDRDGFFGRHATMNHMELHLARDATPEEPWHWVEAVERRIHSMRSNYGQRAYDNATKMTAIYLKRLK